MHVADDIFSKPISAFGGIAEEAVAHRTSDQARLIELLQILLHVASVSRERAISSPTFTLLLSCWDEIGVQLKPMELMSQQLPMLTAFIMSTWRNPAIFGLSALERALSQQESDSDYAIQGAERFGFVVHPDGSKDNDITVPVRRILTRT
jgi:hypothetical protein